MTFWALQAALIALALGFILWPRRPSAQLPDGQARSLYNQQLYQHELAELQRSHEQGQLSDAQWQAERHRLEQALAQDLAQAPAALPSAHTHKRPWRVYALLLLIPIATVALYSYLGAPGILDVQHLRQARIHHQTDEMLGALESGLASNPGDTEGWYVLGRAYVELKRYNDAQQALNKALALAPKDARILSQYAEALALQDTQQLQGRALELVKQALEQNPDDEKALELAGLAAYQREEWAQAAHFWRRLLKRLPEESEFHQSIAKITQDTEQKAAIESGIAQGMRPKAKAP